MGQRLGKAVYVDEVKPFLNLPEKQIYLLWEAFNNIAAGFGLSPEEFTDICLAAELPAVLGLTENRVAAAAAAVFTVFDTDQNDLVDALEFLATFALCSGMDYAKKIEFAFNCYDFDESGELSVDEVTLSFRSTLLGLAKLTGEEPPSEAKLEELANYAFQKADRNADNKISKQEFRDYCIFEPDVRSWLNFYHDPDDVAREADEGDDEDLHGEGSFASSPRKSAHHSHVKSSLGAVDAEALVVAATAAAMPSGGGGVGGGKGGSGGGGAGRGGGGGGGGGDAGIDVATKGAWIARAREVAWHPLPALRPEAPGGQSLEWVHGCVRACVRACVILQCVVVCVCGLTSAV
jgi:Ca2+-binding EF-hand superfamily protein